LESVDGVRSVDWITKVGGVIGDKPLLFNGVDVAIYSMPCLFAAHTAIDNALLELRANDGRLPEVSRATPNAIGTQGDFSLIGWPPTTSVVRRLAGGGHSLSTVNEFVACRSPAPDTRTEPRVTCSTT
jgi:hypothetical protein